MTTTKPKLRQTCLDFGQKDIGLVRCDKCGMCYMHEAQDEATHRKHCRAAQAAAAAAADPVKAFDMAFRPLVAASNNNNSSSNRNSRSFPVGVSLVGYAISPPPSEMMFAIASFPSLANDELRKLRYSNFEHAADATLIVLVDAAQHKLDPATATVVGVVFFSQTQRFVPTALVEKPVLENGVGNDVDGGAAAAAATAGSDSDDAGSDGSFSRSPSPAPRNMEENEPVAIRGVTIRATIWDAMPFPRVAAVKAAVSAVQKTPSVASFMSLSSSAMLGSFLPPPSSKSKSKSKSKASSLQPLSFNRVATPAVRQRSDAESDAVTATATVDDVFWPAVVRAVCGVMKVDCSTVSRNAFCFAEHLVHDSNRPLEKMLTFLLGSANKKQRQERQQQQEMNGRGMMPIVVANFPEELFVNERDDDDDVDDDQKKIPAVRSREVEYRVMLIPDIY